MVIYLYDMIVRLRTITFDTNQYSVPSALEIAMKWGRGRNKKAQQGGYAGGNVALGYKAKRGQKSH